MNAAHLHLLVNHVPIVLSGTGLLFLLAGGLGARRDLTRGGQLLLLLALAGAVPAYLSGEPAEEVIEHLPGVSKEPIEAHEERALWGLILAGAAGLAALIGLVLGRGARAPARGLVRITALLALLSFATLTWVGLAGGRIRHPELSDERAPQAEEGGRN